jgi:hypothetical protein
MILAIANTNIPSHGVCTLFLWLKNEENFIFVAYIYRKNIAKVSLPLI